MRFPEYFENLCWQHKKKNGKNLKKVEKTKKQK